MPRVKIGDVIEHDGDQWTVFHIDGSRRDDTDRRYVSKHIWIESLTRTKQIHRGGCGCCKRYVQTIPVRREGWFTPKTNRFIES